MRQIITLETRAREELVDITDQVRGVAREAVKSDLRDGLVPCTPRARRRRS